MGVVILESDTIGAVFLSVYKRRNSPKLVSGNVREEWVGTWAPAAKCDEVGGVMMQMGVAILKCDAFGAAQMTRFIELLRHRSILEKHGQKHGVSRRG